MVQFLIILINYESNTKGYFTKNLFPSLSLARSSVSLYSFLSSICFITEEKRKTYDRHGKEGLAGG